MTYINDKGFFLQQENVIGVRFTAPVSPRSNMPHAFHPLTIAGLRGKVVLVQFCTYTCINWRRTLPYMKRWPSEYGPQGLQIIGVHTPRVRVRTHSIERREGDPQAGCTLPKLPRTTITKLGKRWRIGPGHRLPFGRPWTDSSFSRWRRILPGDRGCHSGSPQSGTHRLAGTSSGQCRSIPHWHTRNRISASHAPGSHAVAVAGRGNLLLRPAQRSQVDQ